MRILLADDEVEFARALSAILKHNHWSVDEVHDGSDALDYAINGDYDGIILDIMMPKKSGLEVLSELRAQGITTPVLLLTARSEIPDRIEGLDAGADDYLPKPFDMGELLARVRAMTRRKDDFSPGILSFGDISLDRASFELTGPDGTVRLGSKEFQMMEMLMSGSSRLISTELFMEKLWGYDTDVEINVVWVYISYLRKRLSSVGSRVGIRALRRVGYTLEDKA